MSQPIRTTVFALIACAAIAQNATWFQGETALKNQFVDVEPHVKLEVLDWGGTRRNLTSKFEFSSNISPTTTFC
jgi:hypothetical protein